MAAGPRRGIEPAACVLSEWGTNRGPGILQSTWRRDISYTAVRATLNPTVGDLVLGSSGLGGAALLM